MLGERALDFGVKVANCPLNEDPILIVDDLASFFNEVLYEENSDLQRLQLENFVHAFIPTMLGKGEELVPATPFLSMYKRGFPLWFETEVTAARTSNNDEQVMKLRRLFFMFLGVQISVARKMGESALRLLNWVKAHHGGPAQFSNAIKTVSTEDAFDEHLKSMQALQNRIASASFTFLQPVGLPSEFASNSFEQLSRLFYLGQLAKEVFDEFVPRFVASGAFDVDVALVPLKSEVRTLEKYLNKGCDCRGVTDVVRGRIVCSSIEDITAVIEALVASSDIVVVKLRHHFHTAVKKNDGRWADCQIYFKFIGGEDDTIDTSIKGFICELQIAHRVFVDERDIVDDHYAYECVRLVDGFLEHIGKPLDLGI